MWVYVFDKQVPPHLCSAGKGKSSLTTWRLIVTSSRLDLHVTSYRSKNERSATTYWAPPWPYI